eukprot:CAMPEP_0196598130 /NCGR_PEP_ID=MMETSP1081-20130531/94141_1 /TAXON_ID=36882 /ORGANISM="Pyramimonas amylifera, Strain CCMP720" /LENGTH=202 /DNA_ID=CAMNT_0041923777 /DNA_START=431 /DNA_END=1039 /DNA_ORIENTATION=+
MVSEILPRSPIVLKAKSSDSPRKVDLLQNLKSGCEESIFPNQRVISNKEASTPDCNSPPSGCKSSDGEWIWMAHEDWRLLEEFAGAAAGASDMLNAQRGALEAKVEEISVSDTSSSREEALLKELRQMRLQMAAILEEKSKVEEDNAELLKNCHFLHQQNKELKQRRQSGRRPAMGSSVYPSRKSLLCNVSVSADVAPDDGS